MKKILIIGFGSIGARHYNNLKKLGYRPDVFDPLKKEYSEKRNLSEYDIVFVCNPTSLHVKTALEAAKANCNLFIEKPLSNSLKGVAQLASEVKKRNLISMTACNMRFDPCLKKIKELIDKNYLGKIHAIYLSYGRYLPYQRLNKDYKQVYASQKKLGGGVLLDDIHDFDLAFWLNDFKKPKKVSIVSDKLSSLEMDAEDIFTATIVFENKVLANIRADYLSLYKHKTCQIIGEKGNLSWSFRENKVVFSYFDKGKEKEKIIFKSKGSDPYLEEIKYFLNCLKKKENPFNDLERSSFVLKQVLENK